MSELAERYIGRTAGHRPRVGAREGGCGLMAQGLAFAMIALLTVQRDDLAVIKIAIGSTRVSEVLAICATFLVLLGVIVGREKTLRVPRRITGVILLFLAVMFVSSLKSAEIDSGVNSYTIVRRPDREVPFLKSYTTMLSWGLGIISFYAVVLTVKTPAALRRALKYWVVGGAVCSAIAIYSAPATTFGWPLGDVIGVSARGAAVVGPDDVLPRVHGLAGEPRHLVSFLVSVLPFLLIGGVSRVQVMGRRAQRVCLVLCGLAFLLTFSRSTVVYGTAMLCVCVWLGSIGKKGASVARVARMTCAICAVLIPTAAVVQLGLTWFGLPNLWSIIRYQLESMQSSEHNLSNWFQMIGWKVAWAAFLDHPLLGVGIGNLSFYADKYIFVVPRPEWLPPSQYYVMTPVNNVYLDVLSEMGLLGLATFAGIVWTIGRMGWQAIKVAGSAGRAIASGLLAGFLMLLIAYVFFSAFMFAYVWTSMAFLFIAARLILKRPDCFECWTSSRTA